MVPIHHFWRPSQQTNKREQCPLVHCQHPQHLLETSFAILHPISPITCRCASRRSRSTNNWCSSFPAFWAVGSDDCEDSFSNCSANASSCALSNRNIRFVTYFSSVASPCAEKRSALQDSSDSTVSRRDFSSSFTLFSFWFVFLYWILIC